MIWLIGFLLERNADEIDTKNYSCYSNSVKTLHTEKMCTEKCLNDTMDNTSNGKRDHQ